MRADVSWEFMCVNRLCRDIIFRRAYLQTQIPAQFNGKALCIRPSWQSVADMNMCRDDNRPECSCVPYIPPQSAKNSWLVAAGRMYHLQVGNPAFTE